MLQDSHTWGGNQKFATLRFFPALLGYLLSCIFHGVCARGLNICDTFPPRNKLRRWRLPCLQRLSDKRVELRNDTLQVLNEGLRAGEPLSRRLLRQQYLEGVILNQLRKDSCE